MGTASRPGVDLHVEVTGDDDGVPVLLIAGLGAQLITWEDAFCEGLADRGFLVVRFDNRDVGRSTRFDEFDDPIGAIGAVLAGEPIEAPYLLSDMADDAVTVLDSLGIDRAHVVGRSMGGMIAQQLAILHPDRVASLTSIMSTTGDPDVGGPDPEVFPHLLKTAPADHDAAIDHAVEQSRLISAPEHFDPDIARAMAERAWSRGPSPKGVVRQVLAILMSGSRSDALRQLTVPTLVFHGDLDPLVSITGGQRTAEVIPDAELVVLEGMAHDLPPAYWARLISGITELAARTAPTIA